MARERRWHAKAKAHHENDLRWQNADHHVNRGLCSPLWDSLHDAFFQKKTNFERISANCIAYFSLFCSVAAILPASMDFCYWLSPARLERDRPSSRCASTNSTRIG